MKNPLLFVALAVIVTAVIALALFSGGGSVLGMDPPDFAALVKLSVILVIISALFVGGRGRMRPQLWHAAVWLAVLVALMVGWQAFHGGF